MVSKKKFEVKEAIDWDLMMEGWHAERLITNPLKTKKRKWQ